MSVHLYVYLPLTGAGESDSLLWIRILASDPVPTITGHVARRYPETNIPRGRSGRIPMSPDLAQLCEEAKITEQRAAALAMRNQQFFQARLAQTQTN